VVAQAGPAGATVTLDDGRRLSAPVLIGADGVERPPRAGPASAGLEWSYGQTALVCRDRA
jgi:2-octaprenyl-6-methoxyphenol hydroxylase